MKYEIRLHRLNYCCYDLSMKHLSLIICLVLAALFGSAGASFALPPCPGNYKSTWTNCHGGYRFKDKYYKPDSSGDTRIGAITVAGFRGNVVKQRRSYGLYIETSRYNGDWKNGTFHGEGYISVLASYKRFDQIRYAGKWINGVWAGGTRTRCNTWKLFNACSDKKYISEVSKIVVLNLSQPSKAPLVTSFLRSGFKNLSQEQRKQLQANLKKLDLYKSSINGLYGKGTAGALNAYNKQNHNNSDLKKAVNVSKLMDAVLAHKFAPDPDAIATIKPTEPKAKPEVQTKPTEKPKVEPQPVPKFEPKVAIRPSPKPR